MKKPWPHCRPSSCGEIAESDDDGDDLARSAEGPEGEVQDFAGFDVVSCRVSRVFRVRGSCCGWLQTRSGKAGNGSEMMETDPWMEPARATPHGPNMEDEAGASWPAQTTVPTLLPL